MTRQPDENELQQIKALLQAGRKEEATRLYREVTRAGIFETKDAIAELERQLPAQPQPRADQSGFLLDDAPPFTPSENRVFDDLADIRLLCHKGDKIQAIKLYRERKGVSLEEAKRVIDTISDGTYHVGSVPSQPKPESGTVLNAGQIDQCILNGDKIQAIKLYRELHRVDLRTAKGAVEAREASLLAGSPELFRRPDNVNDRPSSSSDAFSDFDEIDQCILNGQKIMAIKLYREKNMVDLKAAKDAIDAREIVLRASSPERFQQSAGSGQSVGGPGVGFIFLMVLLLLGLIYWYFSV